MHCTGVILAGGGASRYGGRPKGLERVHGERMIDRVATALREASDDLLLIANVPDAATWLPAVPTLGDLRMGEGALGGLHAALAHAAARRPDAAVLLVAWDMPFVTGALLRELRRVGEQGADAVLPESDSSRRGVEPLCAWYGPRCLAAVEATLERGDRRVIGFHDQVRLVRLTVEQVTAFGDPARLFHNVNRPEDLAEAESSEGANA